MSGLTLDEVSKDLEIPVLSLEQIEDGNIGAFKDIFVLKDYFVHSKSYCKQQAAAYSLCQSGSAPYQEIFFFPPGLL